jgi:pyridoxine 5-phosphate synthase
VIRKKIRLGVNVDHVATLRNARGGAGPDPVRAAKMALAAGADGITAHLREDRRHINDEDMARLKASIDAPLNFEMAATEQMLDSALKIQPHACSLVPEKRTERTTEGGLDVIGGQKHLIPFVDELSRSGIRVSLFIEPSFEALAAAVAIRAPVVELHTGAWCHAIEAGEAAKAEAELQRLRKAAVEAARLGLECHAGHGLDFDTAQKIAAFPEVVELNIGHFLVGEAIFIGLDASIRKMRAAMDVGREEKDLGRAEAGAGS